MHDTASAGAGRGTHKGAGYTRNGGGGNGGMANPFDAFYEMNGAASASELDVTNSHDFDNVTSAGSDTGYDGNARVMGSSASLETTSTSADINMQTGTAFAISGFVYVTTLSGTIGVIAATSRWYLGVNAAGNAEYGTFAGRGWETAVHGSTLSLNTWYHLMGWYDSTVGTHGTTYIRVDDAGEVSKTLTGLSTATETLRSGLDPTTSDNLNGRVDLLGIGQFVPTSAQITELAAGWSP